MGTFNFLFISNTMLKLFITLALFASVALSQQGSILETAETAQQFNTLIAAVNAAGLTDTLNGPGPFTVFAPTDAAFAALGQDTIDELLMPENREQLTNIVLYHVVSGEVDSAALESAGNANALNGGELTFTAPAPGSLQVNGVSIIGANVQASNGIIHVIDAVLMPSEDGGNGGMTPGGEPGTEMTGEASGNADSSNDDDDDSSSSDDDDSSSDDDDSTTMSAAAPSGEEAGETFDEVIDAAEAVVDAKVDMVTGQMTREEIKALKDSLAEEVEALEARCEAAMSGSSDDDDDDSSSSDDDDSSSSSVTDARECRHQVNAILREGRSDIGSEYWSARSSSSSDDDDDSSSSDDDDDSSSS